jgi:hypothetical protein
LTAKTAWKVNGQPIRSADIRTEVAAIRQEAESRGADLSVDERLALPGIALERLIERAVIQTSAPLIASCLEKVRRPQTWQVREFYRKNSPRFWTPELAHVWHLVKNFDEGDRDEPRTLASLEHMRERVLRGDEFSVVAKEDSDCPEHGGDLGYFARGAMVEEFDAVAFHAPLGELTPAFRTRFGFHTAIVKDRKPEGIRPLEEVEPEVETILLRQAQEAACGELLAKLRKSARIEQVAE